jgi:hypothetical protein
MVKLCGGGNILIDFGMYVLMTFQKYLDQIPENWSTRNT